MSSTTSSTTGTTGTSGNEEAVRYGNLRAPGLPGLGRLSFGASIFLVLAAVILMVLALVNIVAGLVWAVVAVGIAAPSAFPTRDGYGRYQALWRRYQRRASQRAGKDELRQGLTGAVPDGTCRLPGVAAGTELTSHSDIHGRPFGLIHWPHAGLYAVVIQVAPTGFSGLDKQLTDSWVAHWAAWLGQLNTIEEIQGAAVVIETVPDSGQRLARAMARGRIDDAAVPAFARVAEAELRRDLRVGSPTLTGRVTLTLTSRTLDGDTSSSGSAGSLGSTGSAGSAGSSVVRTLADMAEQIGDLLPSWTASLAQTGAGTAARPCTAQEITDATRVAFDPTVAADVEEAQLAALSGAGEGTGLVWAEVGPIAHRVLEDFYRHESTLSRTWQMVSPPNGTSGRFFAQTLARMLEPHKDIPRKRVALLYRAETPAVSAAAADADVRKALFKATQGRRAKAGARAELASAEATAAQEAHGSPLVRVGMLVTVSADTPDTLRRASRAVKSGLAAQARIGLRVPIGSQDMAFLTALPLGLVPQRIARAPGKKPSPAGHAAGTTAGHETDPASEQASEREW